MNLDRHYDELTIGNQTAAAVCTVRMHEDYPPELLSWAVTWHDERGRETHTELPGGPNNDAIVDSLCGRIQDEERDLRREASGAFECDERALQKPWRV